MKLRWKNTLFIFLISPQLVFSQTLNYAWEKTGPLNGTGDAVFVDKAGNTISAFDSVNVFGYVKYDKSGHDKFSVSSREGHELGYFNYAFTNSHNDVILVADAETKKTNRKDTIVLLKYDQNGNLLAKNKFLQQDTLSKILYLQAAAIDKSGNIYVTAYTEIDSAKKTIFATRIISFDSKTLSQRWEDRLNEINFFESYSLSVMSNNLYVSYYNFNDGPGVVCYNSKDGSLIYNKQASIHNVVRTILVTDSSGAAYLLAATGIGQGQPDSAVLIKFSTNGKIKWQEMLPGLENFYWGYPALSINKANQIIAFGILDSSVAISKYNTNGGLVHQIKSDHEFTNMLINAASLDNSGNISLLISGRSTTAEFYDYGEFLQTFDSTLNETQLAPFPDSYYSNPTNFYVTMGYDSITNNYLFTGFPNPGLPTSAINANFASQPKGGNISFNAQVFPNPASNNLNILTSRPVSLFMINELGEVVEQPIECNFFKSLNISGLPSGEYWLILNDDKNKWLATVIKH